MELLDPEFVKVDFTDIMDDKTKENDASDKKDIEHEPMKPKKPEKRVTFNIDTADDKHKEEMSQISKDTQAAIATLDKVIEDEENKKHRIDAAYINFSSSQEKFDLYKPETEDITDEEEPEVKTDTVTGIHTFTKKTDKPKIRTQMTVRKKRLCSLLNRKIKLTTKKRRMKLKMKVRLCSLLNQNIN